MGTENLFGRLGREIGVSDVKLAAVAREAWRRQEQIRTPTRTQRTRLKDGTKIEEVGELSLSGADFARLFEHAPDPKVVAMVDDIVSSTYLLTVVRIGELLSDTKRVLAYFRAAQALGSEGVHRMLSGLPPVDGQEARRRAAVHAFINDLK